MTLDELSPREFRDRLKHLRMAAPELWEASRHLVSPSKFPETLARLRRTIEQRAPVGHLRETLLEALGPGEVTHLRDTRLEGLKHITGLPITKACRALCVFFGLLETSGDAGSGHPVLDDSIPSRLAACTNPFDLLLDFERPSLLDLGSGDLSFIEAMADRYLPPLQALQRSLVAHALDRSDARSALGATYQAPDERIRRLQAATGLVFRHWCDMDMFTLVDAKRPRACLPRYDFVCCWAPANPTFAYEPTRLSSSIIRQELERTRGSFRRVRVNGEPALEVLHQGRALLFPPWKFDVRGPVALLDLMARAGTITVLGAVDCAVFWELLAELVADPRMRPPDLAFTDETRPAIFGELHERLEALRVGERLNLGDVTPLRQDLPRVLPTEAPLSPAVGYRYAEIRRGATFPNVPSSLTACRYGEMIEEPPPWFLVLVPSSHRIDETILRSAPAAISQPIDKSGSD